MVQPVVGYVLVPPVTPVEVKPVLMRPVVPVVAFGALECNLTCTLLVPKALVIANSSPLFVIGMLHLLSG